MHLKSLWVSNFKNLKDFNINFNEEIFWDIIIGKNASGKSNLFEVLIEIFQFLIEGDTISFEFRIEYINNSEDISIEYINGKLLFNDKKTRKVQTKFLPENILIYYSGHNERISTLITHFEENYKRKIKGREIKDMRLFFGLTNEHINILLLLILLMDNESNAKKNLISQLNISEVISEIKFVLKKPYFFSGILNSWDENQFWGIKGYLSSFLKDLDSKASKGSDLRSEGYFFDEEKYIFYVKANDLKNLISKESPLKTFQFFDDLRVIEMLSDISFQIKLLSGETISSYEFSDGEIQAIYFNCIIELFKDKNCIALLDEPDAFLHPEWQNNLITQLIECSGEISQNSHFLISSHCASTIVSSGDSQINLFEIQEDTIKSYIVSKKYAIDQLSAGLISLNEEKQILKILHNINIENKPVFFTEGQTDQIIIETAWEKLRGTPPPFIIIYAFNCQYLRRLIQHEKIYNEVGEMPIFGLFDFDEAFNEWNGIKGKEIEKDPFKGLSKKIKNKNGYVFLLPVPDNPNIKRQVIKDESTKATYRHESRLSIELLFYGFEETDGYFADEPCAGGKKIVFKGNKDNFSKNVVPDLPAEAFKVFKPIFDSIESIIL